MWAAPQALAACEQKQSVFAGLGNGFVPGSLTFTCCPLCLGADFYRHWKRWLVCSTEAHASDLQDMGNTRPESTVAWPLPRAAPHQAAGLAVGPSTERVPGDIHLLQPVPLTVAAGTPVLLGKFVYLGSQHPPGSDPALGHPAELKKNDC